MLFVNLKEHDKLILLFTLLYLLAVIFCYDCLYAILIFDSFVLNVPPFSFVNYF
jgi:hypothetical protein